MKAGEYVEVFLVFEEINEDKDSVEKAKQSAFRSKISEIELAKTGEYVLFGSYEQDN